MDNQARLYEIVPVCSSCEWIDFLMPADNGDLIWGTQGQTNDGSSGTNGVDPLHVYFILVNLTAGTSVVIPVDTRFVYGHHEERFVGSVALSRTNQKTDLHGNVWIRAANNHVFKVPRGAQAVIQLAQIQDYPDGHRTDTKARTRTSEFVARYLSDWKLAELNHGGFFMQLTNQTSTIFSKKGGLHGKDAVHCSR